MSDKLEEILKKIATDTSEENLPGSSNTEPGRDSDRNRDSYTLGDPDCPHCGGLGYLRSEVPVDHPDFGRLQLCPCRQPQISQHISQRLYALSHLDELRTLTFNAFQPRGRIGLGPLQADSLERAFNQAQHFAQSVDGWLLLQGGYGCGKTHLAAAIGNAAVQRGMPTLFITVPDLLDSLRFTYQNPDASFESRFEEIRQAPLLILDDFGTQNATEWAQEKLFQILNYRYINRLPLVVTTNLSLDEVEGRIRSRLQDPDLVTRVLILAPDYRRPTDDTGHPELSSLSLLGDRTFGNFSLRQGERLPREDLKSLERAFRAAQAYAEKPNGWLVIMGPYASGKTHLAAAIANFRAGLGYPPLFVVVPDLLDHLRATFSPKSTVSYDRRFEEVRTTSLLILDDLGTQSMTPWVKEKLYQLFNYRYNAELPTIITTANSLDEIDARIGSRMLDRRICAIHAITVPAYRGGPPKGDPYGRGSRHHQG
jgi:DNA replication protein DnaC